MIEPGSPAPDFTLRKQDYEKVSLADYRGSNVILVFYPADFSQVCNDQLSVYEEIVADLAERNTKMIGISVDGLFCHAAFAEKLGTSIPLLSDFNPRGAVAESYGAFLPDYGTTNRSLVLIDAEGVVRWVYESPLEVPGANLIFDALKTLS